MAIAVSLCFSVFCLWFATQQREPLHRVYRLAFGFIGAAFLLLAMASAATADSLSLITLDTSYHYDRDKDYNESHHGRGLEYSPGGAVSYGFLRFVNSFNKDSTALHFTYNHLLIGLANGYEDADKKMIIASDDVILIAGLNLNIELARVYDHSLALRTLITPSVAAGGFNYQYQWR